MDRKLEAVERLIGVMNELRVKCPWDREQTFMSLRNNTIEETYELVDAVMDNDLDNIKKELGDLLLHVVFYSKIGEEQGAFDIGDVANVITDKLIYRHPHVFGDISVNGTEDVSRNWEQLKLKEKEKNHEKKSVLSGVPRSLPSMVKAYRISQKAASAGFDWNKKEDVWDKVREEVFELQEEIKKDNKTLMDEELGDLLFALVNAGRKYGIDPEAALERSNRKFMRRFEYMEQQAEKKGVALKDAGMEQMERWWQEAKKDEKK